MCQGQSRDAQIGWNACGIDGKGCILGASVVQREGHFDQFISMDNRFGEPEQGCVSAPCCNAFRLSECACHWREAMEQQHQDDETPAHTSSTP